MCVIPHILTAKYGRSVVYAVSINYLYRDRVRDRVMERVSGRVTDRVRHPDSSGNLLIWRKIHYTSQIFIKVMVCDHVAWLFSGFRYCSKPKWSCAREVTVTVFCLLCAG